MLKVYSVLIPTLKTETMEKFCYNTITVCNLDRQTNTDMPEVTTLQGIILVNFNSINIYVVLLFLFILA